MGRASAPFLVARQREHGPQVGPVTDASNLPREQAGKKMKLRNTLRAVAMVAAMQLCLCTTPVDAALLSPGDILVADLGSDPFGTIPGGIFKVDPSTGDRTIVTGFGAGSGPSIVNPVGIVIEESGNILASDLAGDSIFRIDPSTGNRTLISGPGVGVGPGLGSPVGIAIDQNGNIVVSTNFSHSVGSAVGDVLSVNLATGDRSTLSSSFLGIGSGPDLFFPFGIAINANGQILAVETSDGGRILQIEPSTGDRTIVSGSGVGAGTSFNFPQLPELPYGIVLEDDGKILLSDPIGAVIFRVDPVDGARSIVSGLGNGSGPGLIAPVGIASGVGGLIYTTDTIAAALYSIDPITGDRTLASGTGIGLGPEFITPVYITIVPVPEPSAMSLLIIGTLLLTIVHSRTGVIG